MSVAASSHQQAASCPGQTATSQALATITQSPKLAQKNVRTQAETMTNGVQTTLAKNESQTKNATKVDNYVHHQNFGKKAHFVIP